MKTTIMGIEKFNISVIVFLIMTCLVSWLSTEAAETNSVVLDEFAHVPAGVSHLDLGDFRLYRESPPFIRMMIALPVWASNAKRDYSHLGVKRRSEWAVGQDFIKANHDAFQLYCKSRRVALFFSIATAALIFWWSKAMYGGFAAVVSASIWLMHPGIIAHSSIATLDTGTSFTSLLATYCFWRFLTKPKLFIAALAGLTLGLAQTSKFSMVILYPAFLLSALYGRWREQRSGSPDRSPARQFWAQFFLIIVTSLVVLNGCYGFDRCFKRLDQFTFRSRMLSGQIVNSAVETRTGNRFRGSFASFLPVPLPSDYLLGLDSQKWEEEIGFYHLSNGRLVHGGLWYSPFQTLMLKTPVGSLVLFVAALLWALFGSSHAARPYLLLSVLSFFTVGLMAQTGMNWVFRYMIPVVPMLALLTGGFVAGVCQTAHTGAKALAMGIICLMVLCNCYATLSVRPSFFTFGNSIAGGVSGAQETFLGSDFDWGQDLMRLKYWSTRHPEIDPLVLNYFGVLDITHLGFKDVELPISLMQSAEGEIREVDERTNGNFYWAISSNILNGVPNWVQFTNGMQYYCVIDKAKFVPSRSIANVGNTMYIFKIKHYNIVDIDDEEYFNSSVKHCLRSLESSDERNFMGVP